MIIKIWKKVCLTTKILCISSCSIFGWKYFIIQSTKFVDGVTVFMLRIFENLRFATFHYGVKCYISSQSKKKNHINTIDTSSKLEEIIRYLNSMPFDCMKNILSQQFLVMAPKMVGIKYYSDIVVRAFGYYATSRILYNKLRDDFQLTSFATLGWMTSKVNEKSFFCYLYLIHLIPVKKDA